MRIELKEQSVNHYLGMKTVIHKLLFGLYVPWELIPRPDEKYS